MSVRFDHPAQKWAAQSAPQDGELWSSAPRFSTREDAEAAFDLVEEVLAGSARGYELGFENGKAEARKELADEISEAFTPRIRALEGAEKIFTEALDRFDVLRDIRRKLDGIINDEEA